MINRKWRREYACPALHDMLNTAKDELFAAQSYLKGEDGAGEFYNRLQRAGDMIRAAQLFFDAVTEDPFEKNL